MDIEGHARFKTYSEATDALAIVGTGVSIYLDKAQTFTLSAATAIDRFRLYNADHTPKADVGYPHIQTVLTFLDL